MTALATSPAGTFSADAVTRRRRVRPWLGVDLGTDSVKLAVVTRNRSGHWELARARRVPWPADSDPFASPEFLGAALQRVLNDSREDWELPKLRQAAFSLPAGAISQQNLVSESDAPSERDARSETEAAADVDWLAAATMQQLYADRSEGLAFDAWQSSAIEGSFADAPAVNLVWAEADVVRESLAAFSQCGLTADVLDAAPLTTMRASELASDETACRSELVIDWGATGITFTWLFDGQPRFSRTSVVGGFAETLIAVCETFSLTVADAELMLARYGLPHGQADGLTLAIETCLTDALQMLRDEFDRTLGFLGSRYRQQPVERCLLIGGGAAIRDLDLWFSQQTEIPTRSWSLSSGGSCPVLAPAPLFAHAAALSALAWES